MNINQLDAFLVLADCLSVTETARRINCTQPAVTMRIQMLEQELGTPLFDRIAKRLHLSGQGKVFERYALEIVNTLAAAREHLRQMEDPLSGTIHFGASNFIGAYLIPALMAHHKKLAPKLVFELDIASSSELVRRLEAGRVDFLMVSDQLQLDRARFVFRELCRDRLVLIASPEHRFAGCGKIALAQLASETFLIKAAPSATRDFLSERLHLAGVVLTEEMHISSLEAIKQAVMHNLGVSIVSRFAVAREIAAGDLVEVPIADATFERGIRIVHHREKLLSPAVTRFLDLLMAGEIPAQAAAKPKRPAERSALQSATSMSGVDGPTL